MAEINQTVKSRFDGNRSNTSVKIDESAIQVPVEIQGKYSKSIETHLNVVVAPSSNTSSGFIDLNGFDRIAVTLKANSSLKGTIQIIWSHDGLNQASYEVVSPSATATYYAGEISIKSRYARIHFINEDTTNPRTISMWGYLKS